MARFTGFQKLLMYSLVILIVVSETLDYTDESRKDETSLQFQMKKNYIKT